MTVFLIIYILGVIVTLWTYYHSIGRGEEITLSELLCALTSSLLSWVMFCVLIILVYGDTIVFKKK